MKQFRVKKIYLFFSSAFIFLLHLPFGFAKSGLLNTSTNYSFAVNTEIEISKAANVSALAVYDSLRLGILGLSQQAFNYAIAGVDYLAGKGRIVNKKVISIVDFSQPSSKKRLFVIDMAKKKVLFNTYVAHGINSGKEYAQQFSNIPESNKSSLGFYETAGTYVGKNGYSLHLSGLEKGINDNAYNRDIVMHGADYVSETYVQMQGYIGRSQGCPAVPEKLHKPIIDKIKNGTCLFIYSPDKNYVRRSGILKAATAAL
jgi:L,D-transpeptidase catalytic domain